MNPNLIFSVLDASERRRAQRRDFLRTAGAAGVVLSSAALLASCNDGDEMTATPAPTPTPTPTPTPAPAPTDAEILTFALNLEYLEAEFYLYATTGAGLPASAITGSGNAGASTGGRQVSFTDPVVGQYAREIANDELAHVLFLRRELGAAVIAKPPIDISATATGSFSSAARAAGLITGAGSTFDPYANDENFLLGAFIFEDVGVTAYKGAAPLITNKTYVEASAGILAAEAYHAGLIRTVLYRKGLTTPSLRTSADAISNARDTLDGPSDLDQGISPTNGVANIVPTDSNAIAYGRNFGQVLNIAYLNSTLVTNGGFFPVGVNGRLRETEVR